MHPLHFTNAEQIWCSHENGTTNRMLWKRGFRTQHSSVLITQIMNYLVLSLVIPLLIIFVFHRSNVKVVDPLQDSGADNGPVVQGEFTPRTLYKHNGFDTETIYIAVKGKVFDVSRARQFYGPSGPYSNFAGHDASRGLALNSFEMGTS
ncbi:unnamed protein product [Kuraishia capsulata CBS 1993]|uniref:Cytochrome b5 heme-binding domain-containing protein n=1 Tax=Kuraishia capsulata CBS 1993 TaxID=1382522 RepID=W6MFS0_9ASCO|nr:uncharacterized protein KUCA_T00000710001 [Kuraishia capsulata CBS 1993]CDK24744.1 unnamed protein product [Kuraishia capsulata CBS 1993]